MMGKNMENNKRISEIETEISKNKHLIDIQLDDANKANCKASKIIKKNNRLLQEKNELLAKMQTSQITEVFLSKHANAMYKGLANGTSDSAWAKNLFAVCEDCNQMFELFDVQTCGGTITYGICPKCYHIVKFSPF